MNIGKTIKTLRMAAGLSQKDLAEGIDLSASALSLIESGDREPTIATLKKVSRVLKIPISVLFVESEPLPEGMNAEQKSDAERLQELLANVTKNLVMEQFKPDDKSKHARRGESANLEKRC